MTRSKPKRAPRRRKAEAPADLRRALERRPVARAAFEAMPPSHRDAYLEFLDEAKKPETRARRLEKALAMIEDWGEARGLARF